MLFSEGIELSMSESIVYLEALVLLNCLLESDIVFVALSDSCVVCFEATILMYKSLGFTLVVTVCVSYFY